MTTYGYYPETLAGDPVGIVLCYACAHAPAGPEDTVLAPIDDWEPITSYDLPEVGSPIHCDGCSAFIPSRLTNDGLAYVGARLRAHDGNPDVLAAWAAEWPELRLLPDACLSSPERQWPGIR